MSGVSEAEAQSYLWNIKGKTYDLRLKTLVMGILNLTPDSFSDGGQFLEPDQALARAEEMVAEGADILDMGGESTRPGRLETVSAEDETARLMPVLREVRAAFPDLLISVDTYKDEVARQALEAGADIINDVYALRRSANLTAMVAETGAGLILMHMQGDPQTMQENPQYENVLVETRNFLRDRVRDAVSGGVPEASIAVDPGIGFGKTVDHNIEILAGLEYLRLLQRPICVGASRKGFLGKLTDDAPVAQREEATMAAHCVAVMQGAAIVRTHNVLAARRSLAVIDAIREKQ